MSKSNKGLVTSDKYSPFSKSIDNLRILRSACMEWEVFSVALATLASEVPVAVWRYNQLDSRWNMVFLMPFHVVSSTPQIMQILAQYQLKHSKEDLSDAISSTGYKFFKTI